MPQGLRPSPRIAHPFPTDHEGDGASCFFVPSTRYAAGSPLDTEMSSPFSRRPQWRRRLVFFRFFNAICRRFSARHRRAPLARRGTFSSPLSFFSLARGSFVSPSHPLPFRPTPFASFFRLNLASPPLFSGLAEPRAPFLRDIRQCFPPRLREPPPPCKCFRLPRAAPYAALPFFEIFGRFSPSRSIFSPRSRKSFLFFLLSPPRGVSSPRPPFFSGSAEPRAPFLRRSAVPRPPRHYLPHFFKWAARKAAAWLSKRRRSFFEIYPSRFLRP